MRPGHGDVAGSFHVRRRQASGSGPGNTTLTGGLADFTSDPSAAASLGVPTK